MLPTPMMPVVRTIDYELVTFRWLDVIDLSFYLFFKQPVIYNTFLQANTST